ncbi:MAG: hypothetical protein JXB88_26450 [Spirochaetales bacterium]|nr:hypothetical protein [Spirochaetales bacterium]
MVKKREKIARKTFDTAYLREIKHIEEEVRKKVQDIKEEKDIWELHDYLSEKRHEIDRKYDYRYSQLFQVFVQLMKDGYLKEEDLEGLSESKIQEIKNFINFVISNRKI